MVNTDKIYLVKQPFRSESSAYAAVRNEGPVGRSTNRERLIQLMSVQMGAVPSNDPNATAFTGLPFLKEKAPLSFHFQLKKA